jgi:hypothetical protein
VREERERKVMTQDVIRKLVERYPYLLPRNVFTDKLPDDYDYTYIKFLEIPIGWNRLFLQMCEDIRQPLIDDDYLDKFRFTQVKEKYNRLECYNLGASEEVNRILDKYMVLSRYVCTKCGKRARYETQGYIASYCKRCRESLPIIEKAKKVKIKSRFTEIITKPSGREYKVVVPIKKEWKRYLASIRGLDNTIIDL